MFINIHMYIRTPTHTCTRSHTYSFRIMDKGTAEYELWRYTRTLHLSHSISLTLSRAHSFSLARTFMLTLSRACALALVHSRARSLSLSLVSL